MTTQRAVIHTLSSDDLAAWLYAQQRIAQMRADAAALEAEATAVARFAVANLARVVPGGLQPTDGVNTETGEILREAEVEETDTEDVAA
jgi:hypothetical protein